MARTDRYPDFETLAASAPVEHYAIAVRQGPNLTVAIIAPHGGKIEPRTSDIARAIAGQDYSCYLFEGRKARDNGELHITSSNFNEPQCLALIAPARIVLGIHGCQGQSAIYVGGLNLGLADALFEALVDDGLPAHRHGHQFPALHPENICNRGASRAGAQLELTLDMRQEPVAARIVAIARRIIAEFLVQG